MVKALRLLGAQSVISGISFEVAATISDLGLTLGQTVTVRIDFTHSNGDLDMQFVYPGIADFFNSLTSVGTS